MDVVGVNQNFFDDAGEPGVINDGLSVARVIRIPNSNEDAGAPLTREVKHNNSSMIFICLKTGIPEFQEKCAISSSLLKEK